MFPVTITLHNPAQLNAVLAAMGTAKAVETLDTKPHAATGAQTDTERAKADPKPESAPSSEPTPTASASSESSSTESKRAEESENSARTEQSTALTYEDAKAAVIEVTKVRGRETAVELLQRFGVSKLPELKPEQYGALVEHAKEVLTGAEV